MQFIEYLFWLLIVQTDFVISSILLSFIIVIFNSKVFSSGISSDEIEFIKLNWKSVPSLHFSFWICPPTIVNVLKFLNFWKYTALLFNIKCSGPSIIIISFSVDNDSDSVWHFISLSSNIQFDLNTSLSLDVLKLNSKLLSFNDSGMVLFFILNINIFPSTNFSYIFPAKTVIVFWLLNPSKIKFWEVSSSEVFCPSTSLPIFKS